MALCIRHEEFDTPFSNADAAFALLNDAKIVARISRSVSQTHARDLKACWCFFIPVEETRRISIDQPVTAQPEGSPNLALFSFFLPMAPQLSEFNGRSLNSLNASTMVNNPDVPETAELRAWFDAAGGGSTFKSVTVRNGGGGGGDGEIR